MYRAVSLIFRRRVKRAIKYVVIFEKKLAYIYSLFFQKNGFRLYDDKRDERKREGEQRSCVCIFGNLLSSDIK